MDETKGPDKDTDFELEVEDGGHLLADVADGERGSRRERRKDGGVITSRGSTRRRWESPALAC